MPHMGFCVVAITQAKLMYDGASHIAGRLYLFRDIFLNPTEFLKSRQNFRNARQSHKILHRTKYPLPWCTHEPG